MKSLHAQRPGTAAASPARAKPRQTPHLSSPPPASWRGDRPALDLDQRTERADLYGHRIDSLPVAAPVAPVQSTASAPPIQRTKDKESDRDPLLPRHRQPLIDERPEIQDEHHQAIATNSAQDTSTAISVVSGLGTAGSVGSRAADFLDARYDQPNVVPGLGVATGALSAVGSTVDAATHLHQMATGTEQTGDKASLGLEAVSSLGNATVGAASAASHASTLLGTSAAVATNVAAPAAMVMGGADIIGGGVNAYRAHGRKAKLEEIQGSDTASGFERGVARFAAGSQQTKKMRGLGTALKGGLAIGGGIALLLGAGPIGWGLLAGAAGVAGAMALYKRYRKHKEGKKILNDPEYRRQLTEGNNVRIPGPEDLAKQSRLKRWNPLNTKESRTHDLVRAQIAQNLEQHVADPDRNEIQADDATNNPLGAIVGLLGLRNKGRKRAKGQDIARALEG